MIHCIINGTPRTLCCEPTKRLREVLYDMGHHACRDSDNAEGFAGSDTVLVDGMPVFSNLVLAGEVEGCEILTPDGVADPRHLTVLQQAMVDAGIVQSAYNAPAAALLLTWLLEHNPHPTREEIKDVLTGIYIRDTGYENYFLAVKLAEEKAAFGEYKTPIAPSFREDLTYVGKAKGKIDGAQLVTGQGGFVEDYVSPNACRIVMLRSPHASAYIKSIDTAEAEKVPGVVCILTCKNSPDVTYMAAGQGEPEPSPHDKKLFDTKVRQVGDRVAAVVCETEEAGLKARDLIRVEYEVLKPVFTVEEAMAEGAPRVHNGPVEYRAGAPENLEEYNKDCSPDPRENKVVYQFPIRADIHRNIAASNKGEIGDVEKAFREADAIVERTFQTSQIQHAPLEPHVAYACWEGDRLTVYASTQVPYHCRRIVHWVTGLPENRIHVIKTKVGGGYGSKQDVLIEDVVAYASFVTGRPVYYMQTRSEEFFCTSTRHPMRCTVKMAGKKDGTLTAIYMDVRANTGPYGNHCLTVPMNSCSKTLPLFKCDNMKYDLTIYYTNSPCAGAYQGYGTPKGNYALMMTLLELSEKLGIDYKEFCLKNHVERGYMLEILKGLGEGREGNVVPVGSCGLDECIRKGCDMLRWGVREESGDRDIKIGKGFAMIMQGSGLPGLDHAECFAKLETEGSLIINSGGSDLGTGLDTISAKIAAELIKLPLGRISVNSGDTDSCLFDTGAYASSGTYYSGNATLKACEDLKKKMLAEAALQLNEQAEDLELRCPGEVYSKKTNRVLSYYELCHTATSGSGRGQMVGHGVFTSKEAGTPYGAHFAEVAVNTRTGEVKLRKFFALQDCGIPINPEMAQCQMYGAALKSIGHTLYEGLILDDKGNCLNDTFTEYGVPMVTELPDEFYADFVEAPDVAGPFGAKSISEIACNGAAPAIGNAIYDAVGVWCDSWPMTPEKILKKLGKF